MPTPKRANMLAVLRDMGTWPEPPQSPSWKKEDIKTYQNGYVYIVDHSLDYFQLADRNVKQRQHDERCMLVANFFDSRTPYEVNCVPSPRGTTVAEWRQYWDAELATKTEDDLIIIYFHGKAYGTNEEYKWQFQKGLLVNAHEFITQINGGITDCAFFLDCFFHTRMTFGLRWKLEDAAMMDFISSPYQIHTGSGAVVDHEGDWSKAFVRNMINFMNGDIQMPSWTASVKSIPEIMAKDHEIFHNQGSGFKISRRTKDPRPFFGLPNRGPPEEVKGSEDEEESESQHELEDEDEGVDQDFDAAEQFVLDQMNREADIAAGFGDGAGEDEGDEGDEVGED